MSASNIRKAVEKIVVDAISPLRVDFNENDQFGDEKFVRISNPIIIKEIASINSSIYLNTCTITIQIFASNKADALYIYDDVVDAFGTGHYIMAHNGLKLYIKRSYTEFSGKDTLGSYYQLNCGIDFTTYTM